MHSTRTLSWNHYKILILLISIALSWSALTSIRESAEKAQWFHLTADETWHAEVIEVLSQTGRYANWNGSIFTPHLTTGPTLILPAAILARATQWPGAVCGRIVAYFYFLMSLGAITALVTVTPFKKLSLSLLALGGFFIHWRALQDTNYYSFAILGEGPALFFVLSCIVFWRRKIFWAAGLTASLAALSKPYLLIFPFWVLFFSLSAPRRKAWAGALAPWIILVVLMISHAGWNETWRVIRHYPGIMRAANGAGVSELPWMELVQTKIFGIPSILKWRGVALFAFSGFFAFRALSRKRRWEWMPFFCFSILHLIWWWFFSPGVQSRYIMPVYLICTLLTISSIAQWLLKRHHHLFTVSTSIRTAVLILLVGWVGWRTQQSWSEHWNNFENCGFCRQIAAQSYWKSIPATNRANLFALASNGYAQDVDLVISAPYHIETLGRFQPLPKSPQSWVTLGEAPAENALARLKENQCHPIVTWGKQGFGFWNCYP